MKLIVLSALLVPAVLMAQAALPAAPVRPPIMPPPGYGSQSYEMLPDNYQVTLNLTDKDGAPMEISVVVASSRFAASLGEQSLSFSGSVKVEESGSVGIVYNLDWQTPVAAGNGAMQFTPSSVQGSVRLKLGEEVQIIRAGTRTARLVVKKLEAVKGK